MKNPIVFESKDGEKYELLFTIRGCAGLERDLGQSMFSFLQGALLGNLRDMTIDFTISALRRALGKDATEEQAEKIIESHCGAGGTIDEINGAILSAIIATELFTQGEAKTAEAEK